MLNEGTRLARCLDAIRAQESDRPFEVLVVDGGSTDGCLERARGMARVIEAPGTGAAEARNIGARLARGDVVVFTDADCIPQPGWLQWLLDAFEEEPDSAGFGGGVRHLQAGRPSLAEDWESETFYRGIITSNVAYRKGPFWRVGGFRKFCCAEDWDLGWRLLEEGYRIGREPRAVVLHDPSENQGYGLFLRKQVWYARHDVPVLLDMALRSRRPASAGGGPSQARRFLGTALLHAGGSVLLASVALAPLGAALVGGWALQRAVVAAAHTPSKWRSAPHLWAHLAAKAMVRGAGTWWGIAEWLASPRRLPPATDVRFVELEAEGDRAARARPQTEAPLLLPAEGLL